MNSLNLSDTFLNNVQFEGANKKTVVLKDLIEGLYQLKVVVVDKGSVKDAASASSSSSSQHSKGEASVNVTVLPPKRINQVSRKPLVDIPNRLCLFHSR